MNRRILKKHHILMLFLYIYFLNKSIMKNLLLGIMILSIFACGKKQEITKVPVQKQLKEGDYRASIETVDKKGIAFVFEVDKQLNIIIHNAEEKIAVNEVSVENDTVTINMPVFDAHIKAQILDDGNLKGYYAKGPKYTQVSFSATFNTKNRFPINVKSKELIAGNWEVTFSPNTEHSYKAKGVFKSDSENKISGTFLTETGDYRFLEGVLTERNLQLSCFDGAHAFLFDGTVKNDSITSGMFYSGNHYSEPWVAVRNNSYELTDPNKLTFLKEGYDKIAFSFPNLNGELVNLDDEQFKNKVIILQIMGSWCPNCLDESKYLSQFYKDNKGDDLEILALAFENGKTVEKVTANLKRLKDRIGIEYPILIAQVGSASKKLAAEKLPMLNHILSYPTTIYIDKKGVVRKIHTGFSGPATGEKYITFKKEFEAFVTELRNE